MYNLEIQFNTQVIKKVKELNFQVDQLGSILFILFALYENRLDLLDEFDDYNKQKRAFLLYKEMESRKLLEQQDINDKANHPLFALTKDGIEFVEYIKAEFTKNNDIINSEKIAVSGIETLKEALNDDIDSWIDEWLNLFPRGIKSGGKLIRSDKLSCARKMKVFMREYNFDKNTIMLATKRYIESKEKENFAYTRCAVYFIYRLDGTSRSEKISDLATWCEDTVHSLKENENRGENQLEILV